MTAAMAPVSGSIFLTGDAAPSEPYKIRSRVRRFSSTVGLKVAWPIRVLFAKI
jgi:hypothetical protein